MQGGWRRRGKHGALREDHLYCLGGRGRERVYVLLAVMLRSPTTYNYLYSSDSGHALLYAIKIIIALQIG